MNTTMQPLGEEYLHRLQRAANALPAGDRAELLAELRSHLESGSPPGASEAEVRNFLDGLGTPEDIVAAAGEVVTSGVPATRATRIGIDNSRSWGGLEIAAVLSLILGSVAVPVGGAVAGVLLAGSSTAWTRREKAERSGSPSTSA